MADIIESISNSVIHHGKDSDRVYIMKVKDKDIGALLARCFDLANKNSYGKIVSKIPQKHEKEFLKQGFKREAEIRGFYSGEEEGLFMSFFLDKDRSKSEYQEDIDGLIEIARSKKKIASADELEPLSDEYRIGICSESDCTEMAGLYSEVFDSYPFPIFNPEYIRESMRDNVQYYGVWNKDELVSLASSEMDIENKNTEMTDFATRQDHRGQSLPLRLLFRMESDMTRLGIKTAYTISRAMVPGINIVFGKAAYSYGGTLVNNTGIGGNIESMNIWYKAI